jgi:hypothetical protein
MQGKRKKQTENEDENENEHAPMQPFKVFLY